MSVIFFLMMNDMMPTIEETITPDIAAEIEHREWERGNEEREREERWAALEAAHEAKYGRPLFTSTEWEQHTADMNRAIDERDAALENAFMCDEDDDEDAWADDGDSIDDGYGTYADDAWHDAHEYPQW